MKSKMVAMGLCLFMGFVGAHRFYLGYTLQGAIQLFTFGGFGIWYLIDLVMIAMGKMTDAKGNPLQ